MRFYVSLNNNGKVSSYKITPYTDETMQELTKNEFANLLEEQGVNFNEKDFLTEREIIKNENNLLKAQVKALSDRNEFMEDCIAEMAMKVYE